MAEVFAVKDCADDDGTIDVAVEEVDEDLGAHAMRDVAALIVMRDRRGHPDPARARLVVLSFAIPGELDLDAPELVDVWLVGLGTDDTPRAQMRRRFGHALWANRNVGGDGLEVDRDAGAPGGGRGSVSFAPQRVGLLSAEANVRHDVFAIERLVRVVRDLERMTDADPKRRRCAVERDDLRALGLETHLRPREARTPLALNVGRDADIFRVRRVVFSRVLVDRAGVQRARLVRLRSLPRAAIACSGVRKL